MSPNYRIGFHRLRAGVSRKALAKYTGRSTKQIERYENGKAEPPADVLVRMADLLGVTVDDLLNVPPRLPVELEINGRPYLARVEPPQLAGAPTAATVDAVADAARVIPARPRARKPAKPTPRSRPVSPPSREE